MADRYIYSGAAGAATGADWANAHLTLSDAAAAATAGDRYFVAHDHAQTQASSLSLSFKGTAAAPDVVLCVNRSGSVPPVSADLRTTATVTTTGANPIALNAAFFYIYGIQWSAGSGAVSSSFSFTPGGDGWLSFDSCAIAAPGTSSASNKIAFGGTASGTRYRVDLRNTTILLGSASDNVTARGRFTWKNTPSAIQGATVPTTLFGSNNPTGGVVLLEGVDFSALGSGKTIVGATAAPAEYILKDCKLGSSVTVATTPTNQGGAEVYVIRSDSGDTNYRTEKYTYTGTLTTETTIVRTGGASDGTTPIAWKIITTANSKRVLPFDALPISIWNETTGSAITLTIQGIWGGGAVPTDADVWMDVEYLGTSGFPVGSFASSGPADQLASGTNLTAGSGTWGGSTTKFALSKQITPQEKGPITVYIRAALASSTFYIDPKITVT